MHLVQRFAHDVVFRPVDRRTANNILRLRNRRELGAVRLCFYASAGVFPRLCTYLRILAVSVVLRRVDQVREGWGQDIVERRRRLRALFLYRSRKVCRIGYCGRLQFGQSLEVALALLAL